MVCCVSVTCRRRKNRRYLFAIIFYHNSWADRKEGVFSEMLQDTVDSTCSGWFVKHASRDERISPTKILLDVHVSSSRRDLMSLPVL
jgi:hypothetical protein